MRPRTPDLTLRRLQEGDPLAQLREKLAEAVDLAEEAEQDDLEEVLLGAVEAIDEAIEMQDEDDGEEGEDEPETQANGRPVSSEYETLEEFRAAMKAWRRRQARRTPSRAATPSIVTRTPTED